MRVSITPLVSRVNDSVIPLSSVAAVPQSRTSELIGDRPLSARSVLASALLGSDQGCLTVAELVAVASLFGIGAGAARTCLWRMVSNGELTGDDGSSHSPGACWSVACESTRPPESTT